MGAGHEHHAGARHRWRLAVAFAVITAFFVVELGFALASQSLSLLSDAGHMAADVVALGAALVATRIASRRDLTGRRTYGSYRAEVFASGLAVLLMLGVALYVVLEAVRRFGDPVPVASGAMLVVGALGLVANAVALVLLRGGAEESLNVRGAYLEVLGDLLGSFAVIAAAVVIMVTGFQTADTIASIVIALMILPRAWHLLRDVVDVLLEATPKGVEVQMIREHILAVEGVVSVHDIHIWTITSGVPVFSAHVVVEDSALGARGADQILDKLVSCLGSHFDTEHCTFQLEPVSHAEHESHQHA